jgi:hypothetical protein
MPFHLVEGLSADGRFTNRTPLLTIHDYPRTLDETVDNLENLSCCGPSLVLGESVEPLQDQFDVILSESFLYEFDYVGLSKETSQR